MICTDSREYFEISIGPQPDNTFRARLQCLKDFLKRVIGFPLALISKFCRTILRTISIFFAAVFVICTLGSSSGARDFFVDRIVIFAKDLADWVLLPFALILCFFRLILALIIHPDFYFNTF
ncbi:MAG: hypothetical protein K1X28_07890 [Parachlamydiales bacterium]|nr:hypothetical protein [Parachlamydiales bacterium]